MKKAKKKMEVGPKRIYETDLERKQAAHGFDHGGTVAPVQHQTRKAVVLEIEIDIEAPHYPLRGRPTKAVGREVDSTAQSISFLVKELNLVLHIARPALKSISVSVQDRVVALGLGPVLFHSEMAMTKPWESLGTQVREFEGIALVMRLKWGGEGTLTRALRLGYSVHGIEADGRNRGGALGGRQRRRTQL